MLWVEICRISFKPPFSCSQLLLLLLLCLHVRRRICWFLSAEKNAWDGGDGLRNRERSGARKRKQLHQVCAWNYIVIDPANYHFESFLSVRVIAWYQTLTSSSFDDEEDFILFHTHLASFPNIHLSNETLNSWLLTNCTGRQTELSSNPDVTFSATARQDGGGNIINNKTKRTGDEKRCWFWALWNGIGSSSFSSGQ